jgi:flagellar hook-length control protein FliK
MLLPPQGTDTQAPPPTSQIPVEQTDAPIDSGKNSSVIEMIKPPRNAAVEQMPPPTHAQHQQARDEHGRAVPNQVMRPSGILNEAADEKAVLPKSKGARLVLADHAADTARQIVEQSTGKTDTASLPSASDPLRSSTLKQWLGKQAPIQGKEISGEGLGRQAVSDRFNSVAPESSEHPVLPERLQQKYRFASTLSDRPASIAQKVSGKNVAVAQEVGTQLGEKVKQQPLHRAVGIDASPAMREEAFIVKPFEGVDMQMGGNASREGAPSFDSQVSTTATKTVEASSAANETTPLIDKDSQTDVIRQLVQRMTLRSDRQQSQMVIRLKPDFLGNVRLQVTTEGQQVMVRMDAESAMVKEIVEQNMAYLKAELNQHGLEIEKFDVFVGNDNDGWRSGQQQTGFRQASKRSGQPFNDEQSDDESSDHNGDSDDNGPRAGTTSTSEVDYFV